MPTVVNLRATQLPIINDAGDATSLEITFVDSDTGDPSDLSGWTFTAPLLTSTGGTTDYEFTAAVNVNVITLTLSAANQALAVAAGVNNWALVATTGGAETTWLAGTFAVRPRGTGSTSPSTAVTVQLDIGVTVTATINVGGGGGGGSMTAAEILTAIKTVDGAGSGLDADLLDGLSSAAFATAAQGALATTAVQPAALAAHEADTTGVHGIADTSALLDTADIGVTVQGYDADLAALAAAGNSATLAATTASFLAADETKLDGIAAGATANSSDATLLARANHTGTQAISTITDLQTTLDGKQATIAAGGLNLDRLDIDGGTDIGAALVDADLIIVDDGAGGTNRKSALSRVWTYISGKITGAASSIVTSDLTASRAVVSDGSGKVAVATTTAAEIGYVNGVTSAIQTQLDAKAAKARTIGTQSGATYTLAAGDCYTYLRLTNASPDLTVPDDGDVTWPVGGWVEIFASGGAITFIEDTSVTINVAAGQSLIGEDAGSAFFLIKVAAQTWDLAGRLAAA